MFVCVCVCVCVCGCVRACMQLLCEICYPNSKLNLGSKFHIEVATHLPHIKFRTLYALNIIL